jgi:hypothetical protein
MPLLPTDTSLGRLDLVEVFEFFDFPRLFGCVNAAGQRFLALSVEDARDAFLWVYAAVSLERYAAVRAGNLDIRDAFSRTEDGYVARVSIPTHGPSKVDYVSCKDIPSEWLPDEGERISLPTATATPIADLDVIRAARGERREVLNVALDVPEERTTEAPARRVGSVLNSIQELLDALGQRVAGTPTLKGAIPIEILQRTQVNLSQVFPSSFGLQLKARERADLFGGSLVHKVIDELVLLLNARADRDLLSNKLHDLKGRAANKYRALLESVDAMDSSLRLDWGSPGADARGEVQLSRAEVRQVLAVVSEITIQMAEEIEVPCILIGVNIRTKSYEIVDVNQQRFSGKVADDALAEISHATINNPYIATLKQIVEVQATTGEERSKWVLVGLRERTP